MGKRLMPTYLVEFLEEVYPFTRPANFGSRMVTRQFIAETKALYEFVNKKPISNYSRRLVPEYLIKFLEEADYIEFEYESTDYTYEIGATVLKFAEINYIGGMSYAVEGNIQHSPVTSVVSKDADGDTIDTFNIPAEIQALESYGWGIDNNCYNYIDLKNKKFIKKVGRIDLGTLNYTKSGTGLFYFSAPNTFKPSSSNDVPQDDKLLCAPYTITDAYAQGPQGANPSPDMVMCYNTNGNIYFNNLSYTTTADFKTAMSGVYLYYELATPVETDISIDDSFIQVASGGSLTFTNTYEQDVPTSVTYLVEV